MSCLRIYLSNFWLSLSMKNLIDFQIGKKPKTFRDNFLDFFMLTQAVSISILKRESSFTAFFARFSAHRIKRQEGAVIELIY